MANISSLNVFKNVQNYVKKLKVDDFIHKSLPH